MDPLLIESTEDTPHILLDPGQGKFMIAERSWMENAIEFYEPVVEWLEAYLNAPNPETIFEFHLEYFNTASAKQIAKILLTLEKYSSKTEITIKWHYDKHDMDMLTSGSRYAKLLNINYEFIEH